MNVKNYFLLFLLLAAASGYTAEKAEDTEFNNELSHRQNTSAAGVATITVTDQQGNVLSNVKITELVSMKEYTTDDSGRFICDLSDDTQYFYAIDKERKLVNRGTLKPGQRQLHVRLEPGRIVTGKVVDTDGRSVPGATVDKIPTGPCVLSDNDGNFVIGWLPSQELRSGTCLMVRNIERNLAVIVDISRQTESIEIELAPALILKGTVTNSEGQPVSGARMILTLRKWTWGSFISQRIYVDDEGRFEFPVLPQLQEYELNIRADSYLDESFTIGQLNTIKETEEIAPIALHQKQDTANGIEYGQLFVNVVDEDGKPIDITEIQLWNAKDHFIADKESFIVTSTDKPGFYRIEEIPTGYYHVISINEEGYAPFQQTDVLIEKDSTNTINCILSRGGTIEGHVVNEQGKPVEGMPVLIKSPLYCRRDLITDENGRFYADYMPDMHYSVVAEPESESPYETAVFRGDVLCDQKDIKIVIQNKKGTRLGASLIGENLPGFEGIEINLDTSLAKDKQILFCFFDYEQRPSRNCIIQLSEKAQKLAAKDIVIIAIQASTIDEKTFNEWAKGQNISFPVGMIEADEEQTRIKWGVKSLPWLILTDRKHIVRAEGFAFSELDEKINDITPSPKGAAELISVTGLVKDPEGQAASGVRVTQFQTGEEYLTDAEGRFACFLVPSDNQRYFFFAIHKERELVGVGLLPGGETSLEIQLAPATIVSGRVIDPNDRPAVGAAVEALPVGVSYVLTDAEGEFDIGWDSKQAGDLFLMVRHVQSNLACLLDISTKPVQVEFRLAPALTLTGKVTDPEGEAISGARVSLGLRIEAFTTGVAGLHGMFTSIRSTSTDDKGRYEFKALPQKQEWIIYTSADGYVSRRVTTGVINTVEDTLDVEPVVLKRPILSVSGIVVDSAGKPVASCRVGVRGEGQPDDHPGTITDAQGRFTLEKICSGPIQILGKLENVLYGTVEAQAGQKNVRLIVSPIR